MTASKVCAIVGIGVGNGAAIARAFARDGYKVALLARGGDVADPLARDLPDARAYRCDAADASSVADCFAAIGRDLGPVDVVVYNAGGGGWGDVTEISLEDFEQAWRVNAFGMLATAKAVLPAMREARSGAFIVIGATASRRGGAGAAAFAPAKAAQRSLAESMARRLWPEGIHVALVVIDGVVDLPRTRARLPDKPDDFFVQPDGVADIVRGLVDQPRTAWSFEVEARPFAEKW